MKLAFAENVIHECGRFVGGSDEVPAAALTDHSVVRFARDRRKTLVLADLNGAALQAPGPNNEIGASADCTTSHAWAQAIRDAPLPLARDPLRAAADEQGVGLRPLRAQRASQTATGEAQGDAGA